MNSPRWKNSIASCRWRVFEHMRNYELLMRKLAAFLNEDGKMFIHIFTHKHFGYFYEVKDESDWMAKYFFTGGVMPSDHLLLYFNDHFKAEKHWRVGGRHYNKTSEAWLSNMNRHKKRDHAALRRNIWKR